jgi:3D (Asp-Asp-Asp) domain-containing protein
MLGGDWRISARFSARQRMRLHSDPRLNWSKVVTVAFGTAIMLLTGLAAQQQRDFGPPGLGPMPIRRAAPELAAMASSVTADRSGDVLLPRVRIGPAHQRVMWAEVTAYCACTACCGPNAQGLTASGRSVDYNDAHFVAADTSVLPFDTLVQIPGYATGEAVPVIDRGGAIKGNSIDVYFADHATAKAWGRQWLPCIVEQSDE